ncbi:MAG: NUDIX hydrolase [Candidatus Eremiobacteraeota bacterium]|nr:NUDIX hydrolase [Candidatus Eremiobacteraeota bacterium]
MSRPEWRTISSTYVVESPFLRLRKDLIELPNGTLVDDYFVREGHGFAVIFALTPDERVVLVRQFRYGIGRVLLELPSGLIAEGEDPQDCALRELAEETGYVGDSVQHVTTLVAEPSNATTSMYLFLVRNARETGTQHLDATEEITVELAPLEQVLQFVRDGSIDVMAQVASIHFMSDYLRHR